MNKFKTGELLGKSSRLLSNRLTKGLKDKNIDLTPEQWVILHILVESPRSQKEICEITLKNKGSINSLISNLIKLGLVTKVISNTDKRHNVVSITSYGMEVKEKANNLVSNTLYIALNGFTETEKATLNGLLSRVLENLIKA